MKQVAQYKPVKQLNESSNKINNKPKNPWMQSNNLLSPKNNKNALREVKNNLKDLFEDVQNRPYS